MCNEQQFNIFWRRKTRDEIASTRDWLSRISNIAKINSPQHDTPTTSIATASLIATRSSAFPTPVTSSTTSSTTYTTTTLLRDQLHCPLEVGGGEIGVHGVGVRGNTLVVLNNRV